MLLARAADARDVLPEWLAERGAEVEDLALYDTVREQPDEAAVEAALGADYVTFTSASTVRNLSEALGERFPGAAKIVSIGPVTSAAAREAGHEVAIEAAQHDLDGLVSALLADVAAPTARRGGLAPRWVSERPRGLGARTGTSAGPTRPTAAPASWPKRARRRAPWSPPPSRARDAGDGAAAGPRRAARRCSTRRSCARSTSAICCCRWRCPLAVCEAAESLEEGIDCAIKWPNDVWLEGRKLAGVLIEARPQEGWAVIGVGLNLAIAAEEFPAGAA